MIRIHELTRRYGEVLALDAVSIEARPGEILGLLGANGAGKSTLMRICSGLQSPDSGTVEMDGVDMAKDPVEAKRRLGYAAEEPAFYEELSVSEYLAFLAAARGLDPAPARARADDLVQRLGLAGRTDEPVERFSHGMRKKLAFAAAVLHRPRALLCDEALEGFDVMASLAAREELRTLARGGAAVLFSSHVTPALERLCDRIAILHRGRCVRVMDRAEWGGEPHGSSPLERAYLAETRADSRTENAG
jgi:ABC-type multidrug transport system ATPase subunit